MRSMELANSQHVLETMRIELEGMLCNRTGCAGDPPADMLDQIQRDAEQDMELANLQRESAQLREVRAALLRIQRGTFGTCVECGNEISLKRLVAVPWTSSCIDCRETPDRIPT